jgi:aspartokinase-like uncharacterized kinase
MSRDYRSDLAIIKVGGSLFDLEGLGPKLTEWLSRLSFRKIILVPGGGRFANVVRRLDEVHKLGESISHRLALASMSLSAQFLGSIVRPCLVVKNLNECTQAWRTGHLPILDPFDLVVCGSPDEEALPATWDVTSDSVAAWITRLVGARILILLKSTSYAQGLGWQGAADRGLVDPVFSKLADGSFDVRFVDFRQTAVCAPADMGNCSDQVTVDRSTSLPMPADGASDGKPVGS